MQPTDRKKYIKKIINETFNDEMNEGVWDFVKNTVNAGVGAVENLLGKNDPDIRALPAGSRINIPGSKESDVWVDPSLPPEARKKAYWDAIARRGQFRSQQIDPTTGKASLLGKPNATVPARPGNLTGTPLTSDPRSTPGNVQDVTPQTRQQIDAERLKEVQLQGGKLMADTQARIAADRKRQQDTIDLDNEIRIAMDDAVERGDVNNPIFNTGVNKPTNVSGTGVSSVSTGTNVAINSGSNAARTQTNQTSSIQSKPSVEQTASQVMQKNAVATQATTGKPSALAGMGAGVGKWMNNLVAMGNEAIKNVPLENLPLDVRVQESKRRLNAGMDSMSQARQDLNSQIISLSRQTLNNLNSSKPTQSTSTSPTSTINRTSTTSPTSTSTSAQAIQPKPPVGDVMKTGMDWQRFRNDPQYKEEVIKQLNDRRTPQEKAQDLEKEKTLAAVRAGGEEKAAAIAKLNADLPELRKRHEEMKGRMKEMGLG